MFHSKKFVAMIVLMQGVALGLIGMLAPSAAAYEAPTIRLSDSTIKLGNQVTISGRAPHPLRTVVLQMRTADNGWQDVTRQLTGLSGAYRFTASPWYGNHRLRVVATGNLLAQKAVSATRTVRVRMNYSPRGRRTDWTWMSARGARWEPCQTITYRINPDGGYARSAADIQAAFRSVGRVSGFQFKYVGSTARAVTRGQHGNHPYSTDIVVDWQRPRHERGLSGGTAGIGGHWVQDGRRFDGYILLDESERFSRSVWRQVVTHEIGHVMGLGHARSPSQLMHGTSTPRNVRWGAGDLTGLRRIGPSQGCLG